MATDEQDFRAEKTQKPETAGQIVVRQNEKIECGPGKYSVVTIGDGTCDRDSVIHGLFCTEENAEIFQTALLAVKAKCLTMNG